jgi:hypothetical protein
MDSAHSGRRATEQLADSDDVASSSRSLHGRYKVVDVDWRRDQSIWGDRHRLHEVRHLADQDRRHVVRRRWLGQRCQQKMGLAVWQADVYHEHRRPLYGECPDREAASSAQRIVHPATTSAALISSRSSVASSTRRTRIDSMDIRSPFGSLLSLGSPGQPRVGASGTQDVVDPLSMTPAHVGT